MLRRSLPFVIIAAVALAGATAGALLYRAYKPQVLTASTEQQLNGKNNDTAHARGPAKAPVTIEEFGDFQCPPCGQLSEPLNQLERDHPKGVRLIFRHFPLITHAYAKPAAYAAEAAGLQGRFWEMHDLLYREQANWSKAAAPHELFVGYAKGVALDVARFQKDMESEVVKTRVAADQKRAAELGVTLTPTVFVNGKSVSGRSLNPGGLRAAVEAALAQVSPP